MRTTRRYLALIPARGGSKRLPGKNIRPFCGKPLIAWSIQAALQSRRIDEVIVSTDDEAIARVAAEYGAPVPFMRPAELSGDEAGSAEVIRHALLQSGYTGSDDYVMLLQPTSPLRSSEAIDEAIELLEQKGADAVISVCEVDHPPHWSNTLPADGDMRGFIARENLAKRSQEFPAYYRLNGAIYLLNAARFLEEMRIFFDDGIYAYIMPRDVSTDIDTEIDFEIAELLMRRRLEDTKGEQ